LALITYNRDADEPGAALGYAEQLARIAPQDGGLARLIAELRRQAGKPPAQ